MERGNFHPIELFCNFTEGVGHSRKSSNINEVIRAVSNFIFPWSQVQKNSVF